MIATAVLLLLVLIGLSIPVAAALGVLGLVLDPLFSMLPLSRAMGELAWSSSNEFLLVAIPMFIMLGEILLRAGFAERMYGAMALWLSWLPGGLMHANIGASTLFAATSGSSVATAATVGTVSVPQIKRYGYNEPLFLGSIAAGGTLGILIPPSINLVIYGVLTNSSVPKLYLAGIIPGLMLASLFMLVVIVACTVRPAWGGQPVRATWRERFIGLQHLLPPLGIFFLVVGSIYAGLATPTEAAALGVVGALVLAAFSRKLSIRMLRDALEGTMKATAMIMLIVIAAGFLNFVMSATGLTDTERALVASKVLAKCDALDSAADGLVEDVNACQAAFSLNDDVPTCTGTRRGSRIAWRRCRTSSCPWCRSGCPIREPRPSRSKTTSPSRSRTRSTPWRASSGSCPPLTRASRTRGSSSGSTSTRPA